MYFWNSFLVLKKAPQQIGLSKQQNPKAESKLKHEHQKDVFNLYVQTGGGGETQMLLGRDGGNVENTDGFRWKKKESDFRRQ